MLEWYSVVGFLNFSKAYSLQLGGSDSCTHGTSISPKIDFGGEMCMNILTVSHNWVRGRFRDNHVITRNA